jgi:hypothetical protein
MTLRTLLVKLGFKGDVSKLVDFDKKITDLKTNILGLGAVFASVTAALGYFLNEAAKLEQTKIAFEVMTNSVQLGQKLIKDLFTFARTTPFRIPGVLQASKILLAMGVQAEEQIDVLTKIGHVAAGIGKPLDQLASIFGRVRAAGYLTGYEMERLRRAGVPLGAYLSELLKKPEKDILQMIRRKEISFEMFAEGWELMVEKRFPKLMDKLLLTFKGIVSNIQDYIYEIVAFSGEELLPIFKLMANQFMYLLDFSRELIGLKFKQFFIGVSNALTLINKGFIKLYFRTRETITQFGGINKLFKIFAVLAGTFIGIKSLVLLGKFGKLIFSILNFASLKLALIGASMIGIFLVTEDILAFLLGKKSVIEDILNLIEEKAPMAYRHLMKWLGVLKKEIEGLSLLAIGLFEGLTTGDWAMAREGMAQISEAYRMALEKASKEKIKPGIGQFKGEIDMSEMNVIERSIAKSPFLRKLAEYTEMTKIAIDKIFQPGGEPAPIPIGPQFKGNILPNLRDISIVSYLEGIKQDFSVMRQVAKQRKEYRESIAETPAEKILRRGEALRRGLDINLDINLKDNSNIKNRNNDELLNELSKKIEPIVYKGLDNVLKNGFSAVEPTQE